MAFMLPGNRVARWATGIMCALAIAWAGPAARLAAQSGGFRSLVPSPDSLPGSFSTSSSDAGILPAGCSGCGPGGGLLGDGLPGTFGCSSCGSGACAGKRPCSPCEADTWLGRFLCCLYECICCPDPCYEPRWIAAANASFFADSARPQTQMVYRWDHGRGMVFPDRSEFFWPQANGLGIGPRPPLPLQAEPRLNYNELRAYTEIATGHFAFFTEMSYRTINDTIQSNAAGFGDMSLGTKSLLFDCEILQIALQMKTDLPMGNFTKGLGTGHVSLEPSLLFTLKCAQDTYMQAQVAEWIPLGGDPGYAGAVLHYHVSLNHVLWRVLPDIPLIGTLELNGWSFQDGSFTNPLLLLPQRSAGTTYLSLGPGFRLVICDRVDFGIGTAFALSRDHWAEELVRSEFRWRF